MITCLRVAGYIKGIGKTQRVAQIQTNRLNEVTRRRCHSQIYSAPGSKRELRIFKLIIVKILSIGISVEGKSNLRTEIQVRFYHRIGGKSIFGQNRDLQVTELVVGSTVFTG